MKILDLYITDVCNLNCDYCYIDVVKKEDDSFDGKIFFERVDLLKYDAIKFLWWEPLIKWKDIKNIISHVRIKKPETSFTIITNGILLNNEIIDFISISENVEILLSLHDGWLPIIRRKKQKLMKISSKISFYIIFDPRNFQDALKKFLEFSAAGFRNFCFAPEIYANWSQEKLSRLEVILRSLIPFIQKYKMTIWGIQTQFLKKMDYGCEKQVYDKNGVFHACNRFRALKKQSTFQYKKIYDYFHTQIDYKNDPYRWFYVCPVWWYLDNQDSLETAIVSYKELNNIFLNFHKAINAWKLNFLSDTLDEIRFNLTRQCNIRCNYCYVDFKNEALDFHEARNIVDFFIEQPGDEKTFSFFWGEPLLEKQLLYKIVQYIEKKNTVFQKKISYKIATNFLWVNEEVIAFLRLHNFQIHISCNGAPATNNAMRDNSTSLLLKNMRKFIWAWDFKNTVILFAFSPQEIWMIASNLKFLFSLWLYRINFELVFLPSITWEKEHLLHAAKEIYSFASHNFLDIQNIEKKNTYLDIDTKWRCNDNSLEFYGNSVDSESKKYFDTLLSKLFSHARTKT